MKKECKNLVQAATVLQKEMERRLRERDMRLTLELLLQIIPVQRNSVRSGSADELTHYQPSLDLVLQDAWRMYERGELEPFVIHSGVPSICLPMVTGKLMGRRIPSSVNISALSAALVYLSPASGKIGQGLEQYLPELHSSSEK